MTKPSAPKGMADTDRTFAVWAIFIAVILAIWGATMLTDGPWGDDTAEKEEAAIANVKALLKDPYSAQFSNVHRCGDSPIFTGNVNAKNSFGAFTGDKTFYADASTAAVGFDDIRINAFIERCSAAIGLSGNPPTPKWTPELEVIEGWEEASE